MRSTIEGHGTCVNGKMNDTKNRPPYGEAGEFVVGISLDPGRAVRGQEAQARPQAAIVTVGDLVAAPRTGLARQLVAVRPGEGGGADAIQHIRQPVESVVAQSYVARNGIQGVRQVADRV